MDSADCLRRAFETCMPDPRMEHTNLDGRYEIIRLLELVPNVSEHVRIHFETAKNLYLYAWHVFRFHMVAEQYVLSTLEMATRDQLLKVGILMNGKAPGLAGLLKIARTNKLLSNDMFINRERWAKSLARRRFRAEQMDKAMEANLDEFFVDESNVSPNRQEIEFDWLTHFSEYLPEFRNMHAHGTQVLVPSSVLWTFEIVAELINQLYDSEVDKC